MTEIILNKKRDYSLLRRHPWVFSGAINSIEGNPEAGECVRVRAADGTALGIGAYTPTSQIRIRMLTFDPKATVDEAFVTNRVAASIGNRALYVADDGTNAYRLIDAEADGLPGVIADKYADWAVCQFTTAGAERWKQTIVKAIRTYTSCKGVYERSDLDVRAREGLLPATGLLAGEEPPELIEINEYGCKYLVDVRKGQKTGFYLDQRENRQIVKQYATGRDTLNAFSYTGGFGVVAGIANAASVTHVDLSEDALALAKKNMALNGLHEIETNYIQGNVFEVLRKFRDERKQFDLVILDPPKFADSKGGLMRAARGYKDINLLGMKLLRPGGVLATFSCSGLMTPDLFHKVVSDAAVDAKRDFQIVKRLQQAADHPEGLCFPEGLYLKGFLLRME